jgi:hypothetical protein
VGNFEDIFGRTSVAQTGFFAGPLFFSLPAFSACGSESSEAGGASDKDIAPATALAGGAENSIIVDDGGPYSIEDFVIIGYKKVTQFDLETLPGATDAWYGFFDQKDFELRFYASHQAAIKEGIEPAEIAIGKGAVPWQKRPPVRFFAYAIVGNVVMLCELEVASCEALIAQLN